MENTRLRVTLPLSVHVDIELDESKQQKISTESLPVQPANVPTASENDILAKAKQMLSGRGDVLNVRMGYKFENGWITKSRAIVVTVNSKQPVAKLAQQGISLIPNKISDYPVDITTSTIEEILAKKFPVPESQVGVESRYTPPTNVKLKRFDKQNMSVKAFVSPERGWIEFKSFLASSKESITMAIFDFGAKHIVKTIFDLKEINTFREFLMTIQPGESVGEGTKADDLKDAAVVEDFANTFGDKFKVAWVHIGRTNGWVNSSYHIKVTVSDGKRTHLSSGNYQSSNEPDVPSLDLSISDLLKEYNREWHCIVEHDEISDTYKKFIEYDYDNNTNVNTETLSPFAGQYLLVPKDIEPAAVEAQFESFDTFNETRNFTVTPLLTPDNYYDEIIDLIKGAQRYLYIQNQTFNAAKTNQAQLQQLLDAVLERQNAGVEVKIIFRVLNSSTARKNVEDLVDMGFDSRNIKTQKNCHTKGFLVDDRYVVIGSQNISNDGISANRDASFYFEDEGLTAYFKKIFLHDWNNLAKYSVGRETGSVEIVGPQAATSSSMQKIPLNDVLEMM